MKNSAGNILVIDDDEDVLTAARLFLKQYHYNIVTEKNPKKIPTLLKNENYDVIFLDMNFTQDVTSGSEGFHWLGKILQLEPTAIVILITAYGDIEMAVHAIKAGATDFVLKPWQNEKLLATLSSAMRLRRSQSELSKLRLRQRQLCEDIDQRFHEMIGVSSSMQQVFKTIKKVASTDANVLILGENGTGKELVARALHRQSNRSEEVFISVDMGALTETLFESELFGHLKGAFTDAKEDRAGRFEVASGGTLFLDEIGNLSIAMQAKLLRVLEERRVCRLGSNVPTSIDIHLICATNMDISDMVAEKKFRQDFLYRINTVEIHLPPLRERPEDIPLLIQHFVALYSRKYNKLKKGFESTAIKKLKKYSWPGNIRELRHSVERAVIMSESPSLRPSDFRLYDTEPAGEEFTIQNYNLDDAEKVIIQKVLNKYQGNISQAAKELGLTRTSLYRRMGKHGL